MADQTISTEAAKLLEDLRVLLEKGSEFVLSQAPPLAKEIIAYGRTTSTIYFIVFLILLIYSIRYWGWKLGTIWDDKKNWVNYESNYNACLKVPHCIRLGITGVVTIISSVGFAVTIEPFVKSWFAPRLYLLSYLLSFKR